MTYKIRVARSDYCFDCEAETTILDGARKAGYDLPFSCRNGVCGSCKGRIIVGEVDNPCNLEGVDEEELSKGYALFCQARPRSDLQIEVRAISRTDPDATRTLDAKIYKATRVTDDVSLLHLRFAAGTRVPFKAGQYLHIILEDQARRCYSMSNPPYQNDGVILHIRHIKGGRFSNYLESPLTVGDTLTVEMPFGDFYLRPGNKPLVLVASGTGFAPLKSILESIFKQGKLARPIALYWGGRKKSDLYMAHLPEKWARQHELFKFIPVLSEENNGVDRAGYVHEAVLADYPTLLDHEVYACGAPAMITAARRDFIQTKQLPHEAFFCDAFVEGA